MMMTIMHLLEQVKLKNSDYQRFFGRWGHTATTINHSEGLEEVIIYGGSPGYYEVTWEVYKKEDFLRMAYPASLIFGEPYYNLNTEFIFVQR